MKTRLLLVIAGMAAVFLLPTHVRAQTAELQPTLDPLAPFERLIGGRWQVGESYQEFSWGIGRQSVKAQSYFMIDGEPRLVSEGIWYWHPGEKRIRGVFTAIDMPVVFFDYTTRFEADGVVSDITSYDAAGEETTYVETWDFTDATHYVWKLFKKTPDGLREEMTGTYSKVPYPEQLREADGNDGGATEGESI